MRAQVSADVATDYFPALPQGTPPQLVAAIGDAAFRALHEHGAAAFAAPCEAAVAHEAGHGIVGTAEGFGIREITIFPRSASVWSGRCMEVSGWTTGPDSSANDDLRRARFIIAGLAGEAVTGNDKPGSSLDELALSQLIGINAGVKLSDPTLSDAAHAAYVERLWHEQVWGVAISILYDNREPFMRLAKYLHRNRHVHGRKLEKLLKQVKRRTTS